MQYITVYLIIYWIHTLLCIHFKSQVSLTSGVLKEQWCTIMKNRGIFTDVHCFFISILSSPRLKSMLAFALSKTLCLRRSLKRSRIKLIPAIFPVVFPFRCARFVVSCSTTRLATDLPGIWKSQGDLSPYRRVQRWFATPYTCSHPYRTLTWFAHRTDSNGELYTIPVQYIKPQSRATQHFHPECPASVSLIVMLLLY